MKKEMMISGSAKRRAEVKKSKKVLAFSCIV